MPEVRLLPSATRDLDRLDRRIFERIQRALRKLAVTPHPPGTLKLTNEEGYRLRIGDYRVLYRIDAPSRIVYVYRVKHRREAYR